MKSRTEAASALLAALAEEVERMGLPDGIEHHPQTWETVAPVVADFIECLSLWEFTGSDTATQRMTDGYCGVLRAWKAAAVAWIVEA